jgi:hypothetical protein
VPKRLSKSTVPPARGTIAGGSPRVYCMMTRLLFVGRAADAHQLAHLAFVGGREVERKHADHGAQQQPVTHRRRDP